MIQQEMKFDKMDVAKMYSTQASSALVWQAMKEF